MRLWRGCPAGGRFPPGECFPALSFALLPVSSTLQSRQRPRPNPRTLDEYTPRQYWSANFIHPSSILVSQLYMLVEVLTSWRRVKVIWRSFIQPVSMKYRFFQKGQQKGYFRLTKRVQGVSTVSPSSLLNWSAKISVLAALLVFKKACQLPLNKTNLQTQQAKVQGNRNKCWGQVPGEAKTQE